MGFFSGAVRKRRVPPRRLATGHTLTTTFIEAAIQSDRTGLLCGRNPICTPWLIRDNNESRTLHSAGLSTFLRLAQANIVQPTTGISPDCRML
jgi:hypothetical protein